MKTYTFEVVIEEDEWLDERIKDHCLASLYSCTGTSRCFELGIYPKRGFKEFTRCSGPPL